MTIFLEKLNGKLKLSRKMKQVEIAAVPYKDLFIV